MPRKRPPAQAAGGPSDDDMAAFRAAMGPLLQVGGPPPLPSANWARLTALVCEKGYTLVISPALGGRAYKIAIPLGEKRIDVFASDKDTAEQIVDALLLAVQHLPQRE